MKHFLYKNTDTNEVVYVDDRSFQWECGHYFSGLHFCGSRFYGKSELPDFDNIQTVMSKEDFEKLLSYDKAISNLGYGLDKNEEKRQQGQEICDKALKLIEDVLNTEENQQLFDSIIEEEKQAVEDEYNLTREDVDYIFDNYGNDYKDREIVNCIYDDTYDLGYNEAWECGYVKRGDVSEKYFDFEQFGQDLLDDDGYLELPSGKIASLCY